MQRTLRFGGLLLVVLALAVFAAACGGGSDSTSGSTTETSGGTETAESGGEGGESGTVPVDVGSGSVELTTEPLNIGVFLPAQVNQALKENWEGAQAAAKKFGAKVTLYDAGFDPTTQLNQLQNAIQQGEIDAAIVEPVDSNVVCNAVSKEAPDANILVSAATIPFCETELEQEGNSPEELWQEGTLNYVGSNNYVGFIEKWFEESAKAIPGKQKVALVLGQATIAQTLLTEKALENFERSNSEFEVTDIIYSNYTAPDAYKKTQSYLQAHPDTTVMMSIYSPDTTEGVVKGIEAAGKKGQIKVTDVGAGTPELIEDGTVALSLPYFSFATDARAVEALVKAQEGGEPPRFVDDSLIGTAEEPFVVTAKTLGQFEEANQEFFEEFGKK